MVLAGGRDAESRSLLTRPLGDTTVVEAALRTLTKVIPAENVVVVISADDDEVRPTLGEGYRYVTQAEALGTGDAVLAARDAITELGADRVLITYADTPLLRPESLRGLLYRHDLKGADFAILTAVVDHRLDYGEYGTVVREATTSGRSPIIAIRDQADRGPSSLQGEQRTEINVGAYVANAGLLFDELARMHSAAEYRLTELARRFIYRGLTIDSYQIHDTSEVRGINTPAQLQQAADIVLARLFLPKLNTDTTIYFGTGGWRALIGEGFTLGNVRRLCQAIANDVARRGLEAKGVVIGGDRRFLSRESAEAAAEVFAGNNIPVTLLAGDVPTPLVTFAAPYLDAAYSIIITSSHNPHQWNGMKVFRPDGSLPLDEETDGFQTEANALSADEVVTLGLREARAAGMVVDAELDEPYVDAIEEIIDVAAVRGSGLRVVVDAMYGTSQATLSMVLSDMRVRAEFLHAAHNPLFGGVAPAPDLERLSTLVSTIQRGDGRFSLGMATDGDSDRIGIVDQNGEYLDTNDLLVLLYWYLHEVRGERGGVVRNLSTTHMLDRLAAHFGERSLETKVGFKHVTAGMEQIGAVLGGESSGGLTVRGWLLGKDGIFACALVAEMLARTGKTITALREDVWKITGRLHMATADVPATPEMRVEVPRRLDANPLTHIGPHEVESVSLLDGTKIRLADGSWALLRFSGTEPLLRMVAEAPSPEQAAELLEWLKGFVTA
ncbi:MAG: NTP transferase domain-containing protein [Promicromonosporaceae bacterium]|nr:NTP transferase domain-containing protein [Promicromonosporaceae bacterium]